jgi:hypothetical protein
MGNYLAVSDGTEFTPVFIKGINLGVAVPGTQPGELAAAKEQYQKWLLMMGEAGINAIRVYTLHYPRFYEAVYEYNTKNPDKPVYIFQGIWLDEVEEETDIYTLTGPFDESIEEVIDCIHGNREIGERYGRAFGSYETDISPWVIGWITGREVLPMEVITTNKIHPEKTFYEGRHLRLSAGTPAEVWIAERLDHVIDYEKKKYGTERPVSFSCWPTLDPLKHPTEDSFSFEDVVSIDLVNLEMSDAKGGYFASYHAYPYFPNFINNDPGYNEFYDEDGVNNYMGYLSDLKKHYSSIPLVIAEFGVPSSWGNAHFSPSGMHHVGHDENMQGYYNGRQLKTIYKTDCAGGLLFEWIDEWWKRSWIVDELTFPRSRYPIKHDIMSPEQNFGLIAFNPGDPDWTMWKSAAGNGEIKEVSAAMNAEFFFIKIVFLNSLQKDQEIVIGFDTYRDDLGESVLPDGVKSSRRCELALTLKIAAEAQLYVTQAYDLFGIWHKLSSDYQLYHSTATDGESWNPVKWVNSGYHESDDGKYVFPDEIFEAGKLRIRTADQTSTSLDAAVVDGNTIHVRIPWTLLQFTDASSLAVMNDDRSTPGRETAISEGIGLAVSYSEDLLDTDRFKWDPWDKVPQTVERAKDSFYMFEDAVKSLPDKILK